MVLQQLGELVDDNEKRWQRLQIGATFAMFLVFGHAGQCSRRAHLQTRLAQDGLTAIQLPGEYLAHPADQLSLLFHVGDHGGGVRQLLHAEEGGPAPYSAPSLMSRCMMSPVFSS